MGSFVDSAIEDRDASYEHVSNHETFVQSVTEKCIKSKM